MARIKKFAEGKSVTDKFLDYVTDKDTRSVMDMPKKDMRNPQYRKELEQKQALQEPDISPEDLIAGPVKALKNVARTYQVGKMAKPISEAAMKMRPEVEEAERIKNFASKQNKNYLEKEQKNIKDAKVNPQLYNAGKYDEFYPQGANKLSTQTLADRVEKEGITSFRNRYIGQKEKEIVNDAQKAERAAVGKQTLKRKFLPRTPLTYGSIGAAGNVMMEAEDQASGLLNKPDTEYKKGGKVKSFSTASRRGDGIAQRGKTKGRMV